MTADLARALGIDATLLPMTDDRVRTQVRTAEGWLDFQDYFVRRHHEDDVLELRFDGERRGTRLRRSPERRSMQRRSHRHGAVQPVPERRSDPVSRWHSRTLLLHVPRP